MKRLAGTVLLALALLAPAPALATPGQVNPSFTSGGFNNTETGKIAYLADGDLMVSGSFNFYDGASGISNLVRINPDGSRDPALGTQGTGFDNTVIDFDVNSDGTIWAVGSFDSFNGSAGSSALGLTLLDADGTRKLTFSTQGTSFTGGLANDVWAVKQLSSGDILAGGNFNAYNGTTTGRLVLLNPNGTVDSAWATLVAGGGANGMVRDIETCPNGKVMVAGDFTQFNGNSAYNKILRLNADGSLDTGFQAVGTGVSAGGVNSVDCLANSKVLLGGGFGNYNGDGRPRVMRLNADGSLDSSYAPAVAPDSTVLAVEQMPSGKIAIGGLFSDVGGVARRRIAQLNSDGSLDSSFTVGTGVCPNVPPAACSANGGRVNSLATDINGSLMVSGEMRGYNDTVASQLALLYASSRLPVSVTGSGTVTSSPAGISCPGTCSAWFGHQQQVSLTATPDTGNVFSSWSQGCSGSGACTVAAGGVSVGAQFAASTPDPPGPPVTPSVSVSSIKSKVTSKGAYITSRVTVSGAGKIFQRATTGTKKLATRCSVSKTTTAAGTQTLKCNLGSKGLKALKKSALKLTLRTGFTPTGGSAVFANKALTIKRKR